jgi:hypothetical protein
MPGTPTSPWPRKCGTLTPTPAETRQLACDSTIFSFSIVCVTILSSVLVAVAVVLVLVFRFSSRCSSFVTVVVTVPSGFLVVAVTVCVSRLATSTKTR